MTIGKKTLAVPYYRYIYIIFKTSLRLDDDFLRLWFLRLFYFSMKIQFHSSGFFWKVNGADVDIQNQINYLKLIKQMELKNVRTVNRLDPRIFILLLLIFSNENFNSSFDYTVWAVLLLYSTIHKSITRLSSVVSVTQTSIPNFHKQFLKSPSVYRGSTGNLCFSLKYPTTGHILLSPCRWRIGKQN